MRSWVRGASRNGGATRRHLCSVTATRPAANPTTAETSPAAGDGWHGDDPSGMIGHFAGMAWWPTTAAWDRPSLGAAPRFELAARIRGYRRKRVRRENGRRTDDPEPVSHCRIHSAQQRPNTGSALAERATEASCQSLRGIPVDTGVRFLCLSSTHGVEAPCFSDATKRRRMRMLSD